MVCRGPVEAHYTGSQYVSTLLLRLSLGSLWFHSEPVGQGSDIVPGRNPDAMFALNAKYLTGQSTKIAPGATSVNLAARGQLVNHNGQLTLELLKTGNGLPAAVPVLNAVRDVTTGLDKIIVPAMAGAPARNILVNPVSQPEENRMYDPATGLGNIMQTVTIDKPSDIFLTGPELLPQRPANTGNHQPGPKTPTHTGPLIFPVETPTITTTPAEDVSGFRDFIYWRPDATGTGVEPVYVMLSGPYGETNTTGKYSGRDFHTDRAGGPVQELDWKTATIDRAGVDKVKLHTGRFGNKADNRVMIDRLEKVLKGELQPTDIDKRFYTHEIRELERYRNLGFKDNELPENEAEVWNNTHSATLEDYKINEKKQPLYTPEAEEAFIKEMEIK